MIRRTHRTLTLHRGEGEFGQRGFTLIELILVILVVAALSFFTYQNTSSVQFWRRQAALRELNESMRFLFHQAIADGIPYQIEFDLTRNTYTIGALRMEALPVGTTSDDEGLVTNELNQMLNSTGNTFTVIPPPEFPSLGEPRLLPEGISIEAIYTPRGWVRREEEQPVRMRFSPRGFAEFIVLHLLLGNEREMTLVNNPFTGLTQTHEGWREFEWAFAEQRGS